MNPLLAQGVWSVMAGEYASEMCCAIAAIAEMVAVGGQEL